MMNMRPYVIAICGGKRCGKDTIASYIADTYGYTHVKISSQLKTMMKTLFHFSNEQLESDSKDHVDERWGISPREAMQFFGTDIMQYEVQKLVPHVGRSFWIKNLIQEIKREVVPKNYVISDLRFMHEYAMLKKEWGTSCIVIHVSRKSMICNNNATKRGTDTSTDTHISEQEYVSIPADIYIKNDKDVEELHKQIIRSLANFNQTE
jgi:dephospho-CoA kinase